MALESHKGQILPLSNQLIPISKNTIFHANYDNDLIGFNQGRKVAPIGYASVPNFDSTKANHGEASVKNLPSGAAARTIEMWVYPTTDAVGSTPGIIGYPYSGTQPGTASTAFEIIYSATGGAQKFGIHIWGGVYYSTNTFVVNNWYHVAATYDGTTIKVYVNGAQEISQAATLNTFVGSSTYNFNIRQSVNPSDGVRPCKLADVRVWNIARTVDQIKSGMYNELRGDEIGLLAWWRMNHGEGTILYDYVNGNDARLVGTVPWSDGRVLATIRPDGKFNKALGVDQDTTNLMTNPLTPESWSNEADPAYGSISVKYVDTELGTRAIERVTSGINAYQGDRIDIPFVNVLDVSVPHTFSFYARADSPNTQIQMNIEGKLVDGTTRQDYNAYFPLSTDWKRYVVTTTLNTTNMVSTGMYKFMKLYCLATDGAQHTYQITMPQIEQKAFATSFTVGARVGSSLMYPLDIDPNQMTVNFWAKASGGTNYPFYLDVFFTEPWDNNNRIFIRPTSNTVMSAGKLIGGTVYLLTDSTVTDVREWNMYTITISGTTFKLYQNGKLLATRTDIPVVTGRDIKLAPATQNVAYSVMYEDIRIDRVAVSDEEILSWYHSNAPFYNYLDYSGVGY